jgi:hypothetical protein
LREVDYGDTVKNLYKADRSFRISNDAGDEEKDDRERMNADVINQENIQKFHLAR